MLNPVFSSRAELCDYVDRGGQVEYLLFWGHRPAKRGVVTKACLSQWFESAFEVDGAVYPTAEHYMMAEKARLFADDAALRRVLEAPSPGAAKAAGREVRGFDEREWVERRCSIVIAGNWAKFSQNPSLGEFLLRTGERILVEASPVDSLWGIGLAATDPAAENPNAWKGLNLLGFALMRVRERLRERRA